VIVSFHPSLAGGHALGWPEKAAVAASAGYDAVDVDLDELARCRGEGAGAVLEQHGLTAGPAPLPVEYRRDARTFEQGLARLPEQAALAARIGLGVVSRSVPASTDQPKAEALALLRRRLVACADILGEHGLRLAIEPLGPLHLRRRGAYELIWRLPEVADFAHSCGPNVGLLVDSWHWHHAGDDAADIAAAADAILHVHVADAPSLSPESIRDDCRLLPGEGVVDFAAFVDALSAAGYDGIVTPEVHGFRSALGAVDAARRARAAVVGALEPLACVGGGGGGGWHPP
jgi:sugar phosphate isomerase/epimerase